MGGEVAVLFLRPERTRSPDSPTCLFKKDNCKKGWILVKVSLAGNPQNKIQSVPRVWLFAAKTVREWVERRGNSGVPILRRRWRFDGSCP
jgi:hypothetical protein